MKNFSTLFRFLIAFLTGFQPQCILVKCTKYILIVWSYCRNNIFKSCDYFRRRPKNERRKLTIGKMSKKVEVDQEVLLNQTIIHSVAVVLAHHTDHLAEEIQVWNLVCCLISKRVRVGVVCFSKFDFNISIVVKIASLG